MNFKYSTFIVLTGLLLMSCSTGRMVVTEATSVKIALDSTKEQIADTVMKELIVPYKVRLEEEMNEVIGTAAQDMRGHRPESLLSNFSADVYRLAAAEHLKRPVDIAIVNMGGLRSQLPKGDITVGKVFELMPFENELVVVWLRGSELMELLHTFARLKGEGLSGLQMGIEDNRAVEVMIGGEPIQMDSTYAIATNDYLAEGNDKMEQLKNFELRVNTGIKVRDMLMGYIRKETAAGRVINAQLEGRIYFKE